MWSARRNRLAAIFVANCKSSRRVENGVYAFMLIHTTSNTQQLLHQMANVNAHPQRAHCRPHLRHLRHHVQEQNPADDALSAHAQRRDATENPVLDLRQLAVRRAQPAQAHGTAHASGGRVQAVRQGDAQSVCARQPHAIRAQRPAVSVHDVRQIVQAGDRIEGERERCLGRSRRRRIYLYSCLLLSLCRNIWRPILASICTPARIVRARSSPIPICLRTARRRIRSSGAAIESFAIIRSPLS